jgi:hypothetical protein
MSKISQSFFIKIILEIISEFDYNNIKSVIFIYSYLKIIYETTSIYNLKFKVITNSNINKTRHLWLKSLFYDDNFYDDLILFININLITEINKILNSKTISEYSKYFEKNIFTLQNYQNFIKFNLKLTNEIIFMIQMMCENYFKHNYINYLSNDNELVINIEQILMSDDILIKQNQLENIKNYLSDEFKKINRTQELIEILNLTTNIETEQIIFNKSWIKLINRWGIIGFWNFILYLCFSSKNLYNKNSLKELDTFYKLNLYLFNGLISSYYFKDIFKNISPYNLLKNDVLDNNNKKLWFIDDNIIFNYNNLYDYPSEINLLSSIALNILLNSEINICDVKININNANKYELYNYENIFLINQNNSHYIINFVDWYSLFESITGSYLNSLQLYLTSYHTGRIIGNNIFSEIDKYFEKN